MTESFDARGTATFFLASGRSVTASDMARPQVAVAKKLGFRTRVNHVEAPREILKRFVMSRTLRDKVGPPAAITLTRLAPFGCGGILTKYFYTGIRVRDLERSIQFYRKVMGMKVTRRG